MLLKSDFKEYYRKVSNTELLDILDNPNKYQSLAQEIAKKEFLERNLSEEEINSARQPLIEQKLLKEKNKEKLQAIEESLKNKSNKIIDTLNPIQKERPTIEKGIYLIFISFGFIFVYQLTTQYSIFIISIKQFSHSPFINFVTVLPIIILPIALITFLNRKQIGWILLSFYLTFNAVNAILALVNRYSLLPSILQTFLYVGTLLIICKQTFRDIFLIDAKKKEATIIASVIVTLILLVSALMQ